MLSPAVISTGHCSGVKDIMAVFRVDNDIVKEMP